MNNFQIFNQSLNNALTDSQYTNSQDRINGVLSELAKSTVHNKLFAQVSVAAYALAKFVSDHGQNALDRDPNGFSQNIETVILGLINTVVSDRVPNTRASSTIYKKGDVVESPYIPKWGELECITAGTSSNTDVINGVTINAIGQQINDGTVVWAIRAKRFHTLLNVPVPFRGNWSTPVIIGEPSYPIHPEIGLPMWDYRLCDGTSGTIDMRNRFLMASDKSNANKKDGTDTISLKKTQLPTDSFPVDITCNDWERDYKFDKQKISTKKESVNHTHTLPTIDGQPISVQRAGGGTEVPVLMTNGATSLKTTSGISADHNHEIEYTPPSFSATHKHQVNGSVKLNTNQQTFSVVSQHYKMTYIQRIY